MVVSTTKTPYEGKAKAAAVWCLLALPALAQPLQVSIVHQPVEAFVAAFGSRVRGVGLYSVRACNGSAATATASGGRLLQVAEGAGVSPVDAALVAQLAAKSRRGSRLYRLARVIEWAAFIAGFVTNSGAVEARESVRVVFPLLGLAADRISSELAGREHGAVAASLIDPARLYTIPGGHCAGGLFVGAYRAPFAPLVLQIQTGGTTP